jgi:translation initiation factor 2 subunit 3
VQALDLAIPEPVRDPNTEPLMLIARSFDVNKPGCNWKDVKGGVVGGSLIRGILHEGDEIEIRPGRQTQIENRIKWIPITTKVTSINAGSSKVVEATPGGLLGVGTRLDPALTKSDALAGQVLGHVGKLPQVWDKIRCRVTLMERVVGATSELIIEPLKHSEPLMLSVGTAVTVGVISNTKKDTIEIQLTRPVCAELGSKIAISRQVGARWRLIGMGVLIE